MSEFALWAYTQLIEMCLPVAVIFGICDLLVATFLRVAFGGKLWVGK